MVIARKTRVAPTRKDSATSFIFRSPRRFSASPGTGLGTGAGPGAVSCRTRPLSAKLPTRAPQRLGTPTGALHLDDLRGDDRTRHANRIGQPGAGLPRQRRPPLDARRTAGGDRVRRQPVPARPGPPRAARGDRGAAGGGTGVGRPGQSGRGDTWTPVTHT